MAWLFLKVLSCKPSSKSTIFFASKFFLRFKNSFYQWSMSSIFAIYQFFIASKLQPDVGKIPAILNHFFLFNFLKIIQSINFEAFQEKNVLWFRTGSEKKEKRGKSWRTVVLMIQFLTERGKNHQEECLNLLKITFKKWRSREEFVIFLSRYRWDLFHLSGVVLKCDKTEGFERYFANWWQQ